MHIVFRHSGVLPVLKYGGTERIIYWLMKYLVRRGHRVTLIGDPRSQVRAIGAELIAEPNGATWLSCIPRDADVLHLFYPPSEFEQAAFNIPYLVTIEGNGKPGERFPRNTVFISRSHAQNHRSEVFVYNGVDFEEYPMPRARSIGLGGDWARFLFLAKAKWKVKNLRDCVSACVRAGKRLEVAGGRSFNPLVWPWARFHGMIGGTDKIELMGRCDALLFPVRWPEPFGIAVVEAMAMGMPVLASPHGSLPELVYSDELGVVCRSAAELRAWVAQPGRAFDPKNVRQLAEVRFGAAQMAESYSGLYATVVSGEMLNTVEPQATFTQERPAEFLLGF